MDGCRILVDTHLGGSRRTRHHNFRNSRCVNTDDSAMNRRFRGSRRNRRRLRHAHSTATETVPTVVSRTPIGTTPPSLRRTLGSNDEIRQLWERPPKRAQRRKKYLQQQQIFIISVLLVSRVARITSQSRSMGPWGPLSLRDRAKNE